MEFREIIPERVKDNPFALIGKDWMLITAGVPGKFNTMTASWGGLGVLWERKVAFCFIRPTRYTYEFMECTPRFTLSFFPEKHRAALTFCGSHSGRDRDKIKESGLTPVEHADVLYFSEAKVVLVCRKLYFQDIDPDRFLDKEIHTLYPQKDYHRMYVGEIEQCLINEI
ncbi:MAG: flavin reductase [Nitrospirae bacterium GWD2_57_9]|nr:MAG: flavin reductase [Nitrospirae bacterium GWD2_57_9]OGW50770.1 MAG: flavin reductase [Nitrospirae bacterium GWC2_57_9]